MTESARATLQLAEEVRDVLARLHLDAIVIGALALAVHNYPRETEDVDLAVAVPPPQLETIAEALRAKGWAVELRLPDACDPLRGVIDVRTGEADLVQIVNFDNSPAGGFPRLVREAVRSAAPMESSSLRVADLESLIAFKLYAGGAKSKLDILELLARNPVDLASLRARCTSLGLTRQLERVLELAHEP